MRATPSVWRKTKKGYFLTFLNLICFGYANLDYTTAKVSNKTKGQQCQLFRFI